MEEELRVRKGMSFTIEQRLTSPDDPDKPMSSYHTISEFKPNGRKELLTDFEETFRLVGMNYMLTTP